MNSPPVTNEVLKHLGFPTFEEMETLRGKPGELDSAFNMAISYKGMNTPVTWTIMEEQDEMIASIPFAIYDYRDPTAPSCTICVIRNGQFYWKRK